MGAEEQKQVLGRRKGNTISRRSIMKSYKPAHPAQQNVVQLEGVADIRKVQTLPIYTVGSCTVQVRPPPWPLHNPKKRSQGGCAWE